MMKVTAIHMGGEQNFVAHVFRDGDETGGHVWVCVRSRDTPVSSGWLGCWSSKNPEIPALAVERFLRDLAAKVRRGGRTGPLGPFLDGHYFFDAWETWGNGLPGPLSALSTQSIVESTSEEWPIEEFRFHA